MHLLYIKFISAQRMEMLSSWQNFYNAYFNEIEDLGTSETLKFEKILGFSTTSILLGNYLDLNYYNHSMHNVVVT